MSTNWRELEKEMGGNYKNYAEEGKYEVRCDGIEIKEVGDNGSIIMRFHFEEDRNGQYPTADHWLSFKNDNWRKWHNRCLMVVLGATPEAAEKAVDLCEDKKDKELVVFEYEKMYKKLVAKKPSVEIEVYREKNSKYSRAEFTDRTVAMGHDDGKEKKIVNEVVPIEEPLGGESIDIDEVPFD